MQKKTVKKLNKVEDATTSLKEVKQNSVPAKTEAQLIWEEINQLPIEMFALPNQRVFQHCNPITVEPSKLYLTIRSTATLPSLETAIGSRYTVELAGKFVVVSRSK